MASNYKVPPTLGPEKAYDSWKSEIAMWRLVTDLKPEKQALAVALSLTGQARQKALEISVDDLNKDTGMKTLLEALDKIFLADEVDLAYAAYRGVSCDVTLSHDICLGAILPVNSPVTAIAIRWKALLML